MFPSPATVRWSRIAALTGARRSRRRSRRKRVVKAEPSGSGPFLTERYGSSSPGSSSSQVPNLRTSRRVVLEGSTGRKGEASRHTEVNEQRTRASKPKNQILAAALDGGDLLALELGGHDLRILRARETRVEDRDPLQAAAFEPGRQPG